MEHEVIGALLWPFQVIILVEGWGWDKHLPFIQLLYLKMASISLFHFIWRAGWRHREWHWGEGHLKPQEHSHSHFVKVTEHFTLHQTQRHPLRQDIRKHSFHFLALNTKPVWLPHLTPPKEWGKKKSLSTHLRGVTWHGELQLVIDPFFCWTTDHESGVRGVLRDRQTELSFPQRQNPPSVSVCVVWTFTVRSLPLFVCEDTVFLTHRLVCLELWT